ncbi:hypothetical protein ACWIID_46885 [Streptomyces phaeochromogenes]
MTVKSRWLVLTDLTIGTPVALPALAAETGASTGEPRCRKS